MRELRWTWLLFVAAALLLAAPLALVQGGCDLSWWTVDSGGHNLSTGRDGTPSEAPAARIRQGQEWRNQQWHTEMQKA
jgi:hypothetical protein